MDNGLGSATDSQLNQTQSPQSITDQGLSGSPTLLQNQNTGSINDPSVKITIPSSYSQTSTVASSDQSVENTSLTPLFVGGALTIIFLVAIIVLAIKNGAKQTETVKK